MTQFGQQVVNPAVGDSCAVSATTQELLAAVESELSTGHYPRQVRFNKLHIEQCRLALKAVLFTAAIAALLCWQNLAFWNSLIDHGVVTQAKVSYKETRNHYWLYYHFRTASGVVTRWKRVSRSAYDATPIGTSWTVTYIPDSGSEFGTSGWKFGLATPERRNLRVCGWVACFAGIAAFWTVLLKDFVQSGNRQAHLLRWGVAVRVLAVVPDMVETKRSRLWEIDYAYVAQGTPYSGKRSVRESRYRKLVTENPHFTILYNPVKPSEHIVYESAKDAYVVSIGTW